MCKACGEALLRLDGAATLYRLQKDIYKLDTLPVASLFFVRGDGVWYVIDAGENLPLSEGRILSVMAFLGISPDLVSGVLLTHGHWDHTDGLPHILRHCKNALVYGAAEQNPHAGARYRQIGDGDEIGGIFRAVSIGGHAPDMIGYLDMRSKTLFSGDGIQLYGIAWAGLSVSDGVGVYLRSMRRLLQMDIDSIFSSHAYVPLGAFAVGTDAVRAYLETAILCMEDLIRFTLEMYDGGVRDVDAIKDAFIRRGASMYPDFPTDGFWAAIVSILKEYR